MLFVLLFAWLDYFPVDYPSLFPPAGILTPALHILLNIAGVNTSAGYIKEDDQKIV